MSQSMCPQFLYPGGLVLPGKQGLDPDPKTLSLFLCFLFFFLPCLALHRRACQNSEAKEEFLGAKEAVSGSIVAFHIPSVCFKATNTDVQLRNKHESPTRHQPQSQQLAGRHHNASHRARWEEGCGQGQDAGQT